MLHVTNGDVAGNLLAKVFSGEVLAWRDALHEGPVRAGLALEQLSEERARFVAAAGWASAEDAIAGFWARDERLRAASLEDEVVLWFEHDLYDQLQLVQLLDWFASHPHPRLSLICEAEYVGAMAPARMRGLFAARKGVSGDELREARDAWTAYRSSDPAALDGLRPASLRFLGAALRRQLQEFPWLQDDLSLLERNVLDAVEQGPLDLGQVFVRVREDPAFLGDAVLRWHLARMEEEGLVDRRGESWTLRSRKRAKRVPRWLGGVRVDEQCRWRWAPAKGELRKI